MWTGQFLYFRSFVGRIYLGILIVEYMTSLFQECCKGRCFFCWQGSKFYTSTFIPTHVHTHAYIHTMLLIILFSIFIASLLFAYLIYEL